MIVQVATHDMSGILRIEFDLLLAEMKEIHEPMANVIRRLETEMT